MITLPTVQLFITVWLASSHAGFAAPVFGRTKEPVHDSLSLTRPSTGVAGAPEPQVAGIPGEPATIADLAAAMADVDVQRTTLRVRLLPEGREATPPRALNGGALPPFSAGAGGRFEEEGEITLRIRRDGVSSVTLVLAEALAVAEFRVGETPVPPEALRWRPYRWANAAARVWEVPLASSPAPPAREGGEGLPPARDRSVTVGFRCAGRPDWPLDGQITPRLSWMLPQAAWYPRLGTGRIAEDDWSEIDLTVETPAGQVVVANGEPIRTSTNSGTLHRFRSRVPGAAFFVAGELTLLQTGSLERTAVSWYALPDLSLPPSPIRDLIRLLDAQRRRFGPFPHPRLTVLQLPPPWPSGAAHAAAGAVLLDASLPSAALPAKLAHELAHQWWGLSVQTPLLEGLATYAEWLSFPPPSPGGTYPDFAARYPDVPIREALLRFEEPRRRALAYDKLAAVLVMLEDLMGEARFTRLLREFHRRYAGRRAGLEEFQAMARSVARQDLDWFFNQWVNGPGLPRVRLERVDARPEGRGYRLILHLSQTTPPFRLAIPVAVETASERVRRVVELTGMSAQVEIDLGSRPTAVTLDPDRRLLLHADSVLRWSLSADDLTEARR